jgi:hypothetical protein
MESHKPDCYQDRLALVFMCPDQFLVERQHAIRLLLLLLLLLLLPNTSCRGPHRGRHQRQQARPV